MDYFHWSVFNKIMKCENEFGFFQQKKQAWDNKSSQSLKFQITQPNIKDLHNHKHIWSYKSIYNLHPIRFSRFTKAPWNFKPENKKTIHKFKVFGAETHMLVLKIKIFFFLKKKGAFSILTNSMTLVTIINIQACKRQS